eukprot:m.243116 g.243116  ORF g.243116 m.243116 type:complete len:103 (-) comp54450_c2_seq11:566-874(-)
MALSLVVQQASNKRLRRSVRHRSWMRATSECRLSGPVRVGPLGHLLLISFANSPCDPSVLLLACTLENEEPPRQRFLAGANFAPALKTSWLSLCWGKCVLVE